MSKHYLTDGAVKSLENGEPIYTTAIWRAPQPIDFEGHVLTGLYLETRMWEAIINFLDQKGVGVWQDVVKAIAGELGMIKTTGDLNEHTNNEVD